jgi:hypothetical protein
VATDPQTAVATDPQTAVATGPQTALAAGSATAVETPAASVAPITSGDRSADGKRLAIEQSVNGQTNSGGSVVIAELRSVLPSRHG